MAPKEKPRVIALAGARRGSNSEEIMASNYGFVYVLRNECMPGIYKIGVTARSPHERCAELSIPTGVPVAFELVCYGEVFNAYGFECGLHSEFLKNRVNRKKEFFRLSDYDALEVAMMIEERAVKDGGGFVDVALQFIKEAKRRFEADAESAFLLSAGGSAGCHV